MRQRGPSIADVARLAGVSGQTVSRVANDRPNVDAGTRDRVLAAMREVGYRPNGAARALRNGQFRSIGLIVFELSSFGNTRTLDAIGTAATAAGYGINLLPLLDADQGKVTGAFSRLQEQAVDGVIILIEAHQLDEAEIHLPEGLPVVVVDSSAHYDYPIVDTDQAQGARLATEHLLDLGHETVWHLGGPRVVVRRESPPAFLGADLDLPRPGGAAGPGRRLVRDVRVRGGPSAGRRSGGHGRLRRERLDGTRPVARTS